jgi:peptidoglycan hydrolase-like protein with peptidoglycan-binding domain
VCNGYPLAYVDGEFGTGTKTSLIQYQTKVKLEIDGEAGQETFTKLCS